MEAATAAPADGGTDALIEPGDCASDCARRSEVAVNEAGSASLFRKLDPAPGMAGESFRRVLVPKRVGCIGEVAAELCPEAAVTPLGRAGSPC